MNEKLQKAHAAVWQAYDQMTESHNRRAERRANLVSEFANQLTAGQKPEVEFSFAESDEAAFLETEVFEKVVDELSRRHRAALAEAVKEDWDQIMAAREAKQAERLLATEQKQEMRIDADIQTLSTKLQDCKAVRELYSTPAGIMQEARSNPYIPANPLLLYGVVHGRAPAGNIRLAIESDGTVRPWNGSAYRQ